MPAQSPRLAVAAACAHRGRPVDELGFPDRLHLDRTVGAVHRAAFDEDGLGDVVAAAGIGEQLVEEIAVIVTVPQVMVRVDDLEAGLDDFFLPLCRPGSVRVVAWVGGRIDSPARSCRGGVLGGRGIGRQCCCA
jgi:hypothetical protein